MHYKSISIYIFTTFIIHEVNVCCSINVTNRAGVQVPSQSTGDLLHSYPHILIDHALYIIV